MGCSRMEFGFVSRIVLAGIALACAVGCETQMRKVKTPIPNANFAVELSGPDEKQHYRYAVLERETVVARRFLGPAKVDLPMNPKVVDHGGGRVTVTWGSGRGGAFTTIDTKARVVVADTNQANPSNEPFRSER